MRCEGSVKKMFGVDGSALPHQGTFGNVWIHFGSSQLGRMCNRINITVHRTGSTMKNCLVQHVSAAKNEKLQPIGSFIFSVEGIYYRVLSRRMV